MAALKLSSSTESFEFDEAGLAIASSPRGGRSQSPPDSNTGQHKVSFAEMQSMRGTVSSTASSPRQRDLQRLFKVRRETAEQRNVASAT
eukprot:963129-Pyramimonas_sp.AAC.1